ncbi:PREDICTED: RNA polymerase II C-terminal domain phosphatase-like 3 [Lupinus angustifolius]|uniref:RNA polymerase II C-terminal domain phosphatase-like 3 n=1 Tax=Lupinus angustifolius TaxID=3871 RepID=UPI00092EF83A|nr:PREDICTED: RNA polymerase II C-terminal domain phosphatase-like 3 [Lupinus angustifolius]
MMMMNDVEDVEEGEILVEEKTEDDLKKEQQDLVKWNDNKPKHDSKIKEDSNTRVWAVNDFYPKYPSICRGYASGLHNHAWAQAVQNKPLNEIVVMDNDSNGNDDNSNRLRSGSVKEDNVSVNGHVVIDLDKEDGELEEGEIDDDADIEEGNVSQCVLNSEEKNVREILEGFTIDNVEESFAESCDKLQNALQSLRAVTDKDDVLVRLSFNAIQVIFSLFCSMESSQKEKNKDYIPRLLSFVKDRQAHLFAPECLKEVMITTLDSNGALVDSETIVKEKESQSNEMKTLEIQDRRTGDLISSSKPFDSIPIGASEALESGPSNFKGRGVLVPLFDLHKDHDIDNLPSSTREAPSCFPVNNASSVGEGMGMVRSGFPVSMAGAVKMEVDSEGSNLHPYVTDALKAVSSYQQKFGRSSLFTSEELPSPTPSGDCEGAAIDTNEEVSSVSVAGSAMSTKPPLPSSDQLLVSASASKDRSSMHGLSSSGVDATGSGSLPRKPSVKPRDPRLRLINSDASALDLNHRPSLVNNMPKVETIISRKQKAAEEPPLDVAVSKRLKTSLENSEHNTRDPRTAARNYGWLEEMTPVGSPLIERNNVEADPKKTISTVNSLCTGSSYFNVTSNVNQQVPVATSNATVSIPAVWKDLAVNPTMLVNILLERHKLAAAEAKKKPDDYSRNSLHLANANSALGTGPTMSFGTSMTTGFQKNSVGMLPVSAPATTAGKSIQDNSGNVRMKPRDPRCILHGNTLPKIGGLGREQSEAIVSPTPNNQGKCDNVSAPKLEVRSDTKLAPSQSSASPDIAGQFPKNLKNIADIISVTRPSSNDSPATQTFSSAPVLTSDRVEQKPVASSSQNLQAGVGSVPETCASVSLTPQSTWGDVEHLFKGYDEKQKAAIQRERARRIEEQNKMFAARKLCLVLDLDHTLLNSAKFVEVDPVHEEILRKKEKQDREKHHRHLFRFPHMGMWTKLRPGIWNFLEKASKLFELHVYTMGNKRYATEMAKVLDPKGTLFKGRVISRGDDTDSVDGEERAPKIKDLEGVLGMESAVVIIDDSVRVWPHNKLNLIVVERYTYFPCSRRQFGLPGPSLLEIDHDERPEAGTLASSLGVIERLHQNFFASQSLEEVDVRNILASEQRKILAGCRIVFSRMFPVDEANPHLHPLWQTAEQFGAVCTNHIDDHVTHVVTCSPGTDKVTWALSTGRFVVHPSWYVPFRLHLCSPTL